MRPTHAYISYMHYHSPFLTLNLTASLSLTILIQYMASLSSPHAFARWVRYFKIVFRQISLRKMKLTTNRLLVILSIAFICNLEITLPSYRKNSKIQWKLEKYYTMWSIMTSTLWYAYITSCYRMNAFCKFLSQEWENFEMMSETFEDCIQFTWIFKKTKRYSFITNVQSIFVLVWFSTLLQRIYGAC